MRAMQARQSVHQLGEDRQDLVLDNPKLVAKCAGTVARAVLGNNCTITVETYSRNEIITKKTTHDKAKAKISFQILKYAFTFVSHLNIGRSTLASSCPQPIWMLSTLTTRTDTACRDYHQ